MVKKIEAKLQAVQAAWERMEKWKEALLIWGFFTVVVFGTIIITRTWTSGFHLVDDWEFAKYVDTISTRGFLVCMKETLSEDLSFRFRPLYYIIRVCMAAVFGINLQILSVIKAAEIVLAMGCFYYCARNLRCNVVCALLFSLTVMVGYQSVVWWKLGPQESYGIMIFSVGFLMLIKWLEQGKRYQIVLSLTAFLIMALYKESFLLLLPFIMLYLVYDRMKREKLPVTIRNLWLTVWKNIPVLSGLAFILLAALFLLVFVIGTNNYTYVGLDSAVTLSQYHDVWCQAFHGELKWYVRFGVLFFAIMLTYWEQFKKLGWEIILTLSIVLPQVVIYSKPAITERYILPAVFGFAFFFVLAGCNWKALSGKRRAAYMLGLFLMLAAHGRAMLLEAKYFTYRGNSVQTMLDTTAQYLKEHEEGKVLSCLGPNEEGNMTIRCLLRLQNLEGGAFYWKEDDLMIYADTNDWGCYSYPCLDMFDEIDVVIMYNREDRHWCYEPSLDLSDFTEEKCGTLTMYYRKK